MINALQLACQNWKMCLKPVDDVSALLGIRPTQMQTNQIRIKCFNSLFTSNYQVGIVFYDDGALQ